MKKDSDSVEESPELSTRRHGLNLDSSRFFETQYRWGGYLKGFPRVWLLPTFLKQDFPCDMF